MHSSIGRRVRNSWRLIETKETGETVGTNGDTHQQIKGRRVRDCWRLRETKETKETLEIKYRYVHNYRKRNERLLETEGNQGDQRL